MSLGNRPAIVIDLGGTSMRTALAHADSLVGRVQRPTPAREGPDAVVAALVDSVVAACDAAAIPLQQCAALGIACPGPLNGRTGIVYSPPNLYGWANVPLAALLRARLALPVFLIKDTNAAALAEHRQGAGRGTTTMLYVTVSTGVGGGLILDGRLYEGLDGTAGEIGHVCVDRNGPLCNCGNIGCLEAVASGTAIARVAAARIAAGAMPAPGGVRAPSAQEVIAAAQLGEPEARVLIAEVGRTLGLAFVGLAHLFNPEAIVMGGGVLHGGPLIIDPLRQTFARHTMPVPRVRAQVISAELGDDVGLWGAAIHAHNQLLA